jgi:hypothetical protein
MTIPRTAGGPGVLALASGLARGRRQRDPVSSLACSGEIERSAGSEPVICAAAKQPAQLKREGRHDRMQHMGARATSPRRSTWTSPCQLLTSGMPVLAAST